MRGDERLAALERCAVIVGGVYVAGVGINMLTRGYVRYANYLRWPAFAPFAVVVGVGLIVIGLRRSRNSR